MTNHVLYDYEDFKNITSEELKNKRFIYDLVVYGGLAICKICGEYEAGLDSPCKKR